MKRILFLSSLLMATATVQAQKIDFDMAGRQPSEVTEDGYTGWAVAGAADTKTVDGITFTIEAAGGANMLRPQWSKADVKSGKPT